eukprot:2119989-Pleurochrysis_carterae.AAC.1
MRHALPPNSFGSRPASDAIACAKRRESADDHGRVSSAPTKRGVLLGVPNVLSPSGTLGARSCHVAHNA